MLFSMIPMQCLSQNSKLENFGYFMERFKNPWSMGGGGVVPHIQTPRQGVRKSDFEFFFASKSRKEKRRTLVDMQTINETIQGLLYLYIGCQKLLPQNWWVCLDWEVQYVFEASLLDSYILQWFVAKIEFLLSSCSERFHLSPSAPQCQPWSQIKCKLKILRQHLSFILRQKI